MKEDTEIDIEELQVILGIENKAKEIENLFSNQNSHPNSFLHAVSLISNSNQLGSNLENPMSQPQKDEIQNILKNSCNFYSLDNKEKFNIEINKPSKKKPLEDYEIIIKEAKENNQNKNNNKNNINNNINNNMVNNKVSLDNKKDSLDNNKDSLDNNKINLDNHKINSDNNKDIVIIITNISNMVFYYMIKI